jgi:hypothetical protein
MPVWSRAVVVAAVVGLAATAVLGEPLALQPQGRQSSADAADPCRFFRGQAQARGLADYTQDMLWACEEISRRRSSQIPLGDRLEATGDRLDAYREAIIAAGNAAFTGRGRPGFPPRSLGLSHDEKLAIADATGTLLALEAIRRGF